MFIRLLVFLEVFTSKKKLHSDIIDVVMIGRLEIELQRREEQCVCALNERLHRKQKKFHII